MNLDFILLGLLLAAISGLLFCVRLYFQQRLSLETLKVRMETENKALREALDSEQELLTKTKEQLSDTFQSLATSVMEGNTKQFLELAKATLNKESSLAQSELEKRRQSIEDMLKPLNTVLDKYQDQLHQIEKGRQVAYTTLEKEIKKMAEVGVNLSQETTALKNALKKPHVRGRWGEVQLKNCVEIAGMSEFSDVTFQNASVDEDGQRLIPDMTVRMPGGRVIVVDAKTPIDAFLSSLESSTEEERTIEMTRHGRHVKDHVKKLSAKSYNENLKETADFTVMFLPNESFLYAALESEPDLMEYALQKKVLIATPPTLVGLLKVIRYGWNEERLAENALQISDAGKELHKRICDFAEAFVSIGKAIEKAKSEYDTSRMRLESRVLGQARRLEQLGAKSHKNLPESVQSSLPTPTEV